MVKLFKWHDEHNIFVMIYTVLLGLAHGCSTVQERLRQSLISHECRSWTKNVHVRATLDQAGWGLPVMYFETLFCRLGRPKEKNL